MRTLEPIHHLLVASELFRGCCQAAAQAYGEPMPEALRLLELGDLVGAAAELGGDSLAGFVLRELWDTWDEDDDAGAGTAGAMAQALGDLERVHAAVVGYFDALQQ